MKTIFKTIFAAAALLLVVNVSAQDSPVQFGVKAGMNLSNMTSDLKEDAKIGFNIGATVDYALTQDLYLMSGLAFSQKGIKDGEAKINISYLELPVHVGYKFQVTESTKLVLHAGPYLGYALDGKYKMGIASVDAFSKELENALGFNYKRLDFGVGLGLGAEFNKICVGLGCDLGLGNMIDVKDAALVGEITGITSPKGNNLNTYLSVGYKF